MIKREWWSCFLSPRTRDGVKQGALESALNVPFSQLELRQPPGTSGSVPTATKSGLEATTEDHLKRDESLSSLASPKSVCGGHPYHE